VKKQRNLMHAKLVFPPKGVALLDSILHTVLHFRKKPSLVLTKD